MSQIMDKVLETENACEERVKAARAEALQTAADADRQASQMTENARQRAAELADEILKQANEEAGRIIAQGKRGSEAAAQALKNEAQEKFDAASKAVASMLLKIS